MKMCIFKNWDILFYMLFPHSHLVLQNPSKNNWVWLLPNWISSYLTDLLFIAIKIQMFTYEPIHPNLQVSRWEPSKGNNYAFF